MHPPGALAAGADAAEFGPSSRWPCEPMLSADVAVSSDNMSPGDSSALSPLVQYRTRVTRVFRGAGRDTKSHAGYAAGGTFNSGLVFIRASKRGLQFAEAWHGNVVHPPRGSRYASLTSDQQVKSPPMKHGAPCIGRMNSAISLGDFSRRSSTT